MFPTRPSSALRTAAALPRPVRKVEILKQELAMMGVRQLTTTGIPTGDALLRSARGVSNTGGSDGGSGSSLSVLHSLRTPNGCPSHEKTVVRVSHDEHEEDADMLHIGSHFGPPSGSDPLATETHKVWQVPRRSWSSSHSCNPRVNELKMHAETRSGRPRDARRNNLREGHHKETVRGKADTVGVGAREEYLQFMPGCGTSIEAESGSSDGEGEGWWAPSADELVLDRNHDHDLESTQHPHGMTIAHVDGDGNPAGGTSGKQRQGWGGLCHERGSFQDPRRQVGQEGSLQWGSGRGTGRGTPVARRPQTWFEARQESHPTSANQSLARVSWSASLDASSSVPAVELASDGNGGYGTASRRLARTIHRPTQGTSSDFNPPVETARNHTTEIFAGGRSSREEDAAGSQLGRRSWTHGEAAEPYNGGACPRTLGPVPATSPTARRDRSGREVSTVSRSNANGGSMASDQVVRVGGRSHLEMKC